MILVDRYVYDVTRQLPEKQRDDVARELKTEILEMVDGEAKGKKPTKKHEYDVLLRLGRPSQLADSYRDRPRYVIGPEYYESYVELLKTLLVVVLPIIAFLTFTTQLMVSRDSIVVNFIQAAGASFEVGLHIFFWTTAIFFVLDKTLAGTRYREEKNGLRTPCRKCRRSKRLAEQNRILVSRGVFLQSSQHCCNFRRFIRRYSQMYRCFLHQACGPAGSSAC